MDISIPKIEEFLWCYIENFAQLEYNIKGNADLSKLNGTDMAAVHIGKLCKLAAGVMNTHSRVADGRVQVFTAEAALHGASPTLCRALMDSATSDACLELLRQAGLDGPVLAGILERAAEHLARRAPGVETGLLFFSNQYGLLGQTENVKELLGL